MNACYHTRTIVVAPPLVLGGLALVTVVLLPGIAHVWGRWRVSRWCAREGFELVVGSLLFGKWWAPFGWHVRVEWE